MVREAAVVPARNLRRRPKMPRLNASTWASARRAGNGSHRVNRRLLGARRTCGYADESALTIWISRPVGRTSGAFGLGGSRGGVVLRGRDAHAVERAPDEHERG